MKSAVALYLIWNQDLSGKSVPDPAKVTELAQTLRGDFSGSSNIRAELRSSPAATLSLCNAWSRLRYYEYYRFAFDTARKAEQTMKRELMCPELDSQTFVKFNYWDGGRKGLLAGEALHLDVKRMEMAYHDNNKRELELTLHVSPRQLNPLALLTLRSTCSCQVIIPEWALRQRLPGTLYAAHKERCSLYSIGCGALYQRQLHALATL
jgi:Tc toxin complex TcA C-terminal TcB-binding domain